MGLQELLDWFDYLMFGAPREQLFKQIAKAIGFYSSIIS
jgi:hypothetical protein